MFYLAWLTDHRAEFQQLVRERLGADVASQVLWSSPRLICVAEDYTRYDLHAVREIRRTIDLVRYSYFGTGLLALEPVAKATAGAQGRSEQRRRRPSASVGMPEDPIAGLRNALDELLQGLGDDVSSVDRKQYRAYRRLRNFACVSHAHRQEVVVTLHLDAKDVDLVGGFTRDVSQIGHHGTGDVEVRLRTEGDLGRAEQLLRMSYEAA
nr:DUF5655 domain-containing protein [Streptomyces globisporus]